MTPRDPLELDPETYVAAEIVKAQPPMKTPPDLPGMTPAPITIERSPRLVRSGGRLRIHSHSIGTGPTCPNCHCGRKET